MAAWSDGYFTDIQYTGKFYAEMAPGFMAFACLRQGVRPPRLGSGATYLELGCGQGYSLNLLAAANPGMAFLGVDFHPGQIANARRLAEAAGLTNVAFEDFSFEQMLVLPDGRLPKCEVIALHGVWSWVSPANRGFIVQVLDRLLEPGGLAYVSYNCLPGWAPLAPLQRFLAEYVARAPGDPQVEVRNAFRAAYQLLESDSAFFSSSPVLRERIEEGLRAEPAYLVHEYLNAHSQPVFHADVARELDGARLTYAASANIAGDFVHLAAPAALQPMIHAAQDPIWKETLLDYASPKLFRRDVFVRGRNSLPAPERTALLGAMRFELLIAPKGAGFEFPIPIGQLQGDRSLYGALVSALADGPRSYAELAAVPEVAGAKDGALLQAISLLVGGRYIHPAAETEGGGEAALAFNRAVLARTAFDEFPNHLASSAAGTGVPVTFAGLLALQAIVEGENDPARIASRAWGVMARTGMRLKTDGGMLTDQAANEAELAARVAAFKTTKLPRLQRLGVA